LLKNNGFGEGLSAMSFCLMQTLLPPAPATASTRSTGLPSFVYSPSFILFLFLLSLFYFSFVFLPLSFLFSFYFLFISFLLFISFSSFPPLIFLVALLEDARKGIINNNYSFVAKRKIPLFRGALQSHQDLTFSTFPSHFP
jgi:pilus assembly protein TadC